LLFKEGCKGKINYKLLALVFLRRSPFGKSCIAVLGGGLKTMPLGCYFDVGIFMKNKIYLFAFMNMIKYSGMNKLLIKG
jgi:hypothetical protein